MDIITALCFAVLGFSLFFVLRKNHLLVREASVAKASEAKLRLAANVFTHAHEGIMMTDHEGTIIEINEAFTRLSGYSRTEIIGRNPRILKSGRHGQDFYKVLWSALLEKGHWRGEIWDHKKSGESYAAFLSIDAVRDEKGKLENYVALFSDITAIKRQQEHLERLAHFDPLTGLPNRLLFHDRLNQAMAHVQRRGQQLALAYIDLDGFKTVNDMHGHALGDQLLIALPKRMRQTLRESDTIARLGGDEFSVILTDLQDLDTTLPLLERLVSASAEPVSLGEQVLNVSASIGVVFYPHGDEADGDELLHRADKAMYQAKQAGKNRFHILGT